MDRSEDVVIGGGQQQNQQSTNNNNSFQLNSTNGDINYGSLLNANSSAGSSAGGGGGGNGNNNGMNGSTVANSTSNNNNNNNVYTMPGILHFLQHEWNRFEYERQQWEIDRSELMTKISFLQGERRGQESLKNNLIRRIKMLELALKQERVKYHKLKFGVEPSSSSSSTSSANDMLKLPSASRNGGLNETDEAEFSIGKHPILNKENSCSSTIKQGRQLLKQYLQEIGYTDSVIDIRSAQLRSLLGLGGNLVTGGNKTTNDLEQLLTSGAQNIEASIAGLINKQQQLLQLSSNFKKSTSQQQNGSLSANDVEKMLKLGSSESGNAKHNYNTNNNHRSNNDEDEEMNEEDTNNNNNKLRSTENIDEEQIDADTEDALNEFAFLSNEKSSSSSSSSLDHHGGRTDTSADDWDVDRTQLNELTEQYKKERRSTTKTGGSGQHSTASSSTQFTIGGGNSAAANSSLSSQRPNRTALQAMMANLSENEAESSSKLVGGGGGGGGVLSTAPSSTTAFAHHHNVSSGGLFLEDDLDSSLGELSRISVNNNTLNLSGINDETIESTQNKVLTAKVSLRGHFDSVRCLAFHPTESALLTGSEDETIKLWNLDKSPLNSKKSVNTDIEPAYTFRRHTGPVLSLLVSPNGDFCISSGLDSKVFVWNMPNFDTCDQYDQYNPNVFLKSLNGHTDAVWQMALVDNTLVTVSADSTIRIWNPFSIDELDETAAVSLSCLNEDKSEGTPTSVDFVNNENTKIVASFAADRSSSSSSSHHHCLYDIETSKIITKFDYHDSRQNTHCYKVLSHPVSAATPSSSLIMSAHEDKKIRFFDINSGKMTYQLVAHQEACTDLAIDPTCIYLLSASHDCSIRLWNLETKSCVQELTSHRKKYDESINCIAFHPTKPFVASGAADAIVKIYV